MADTTDATQSGQAANYMEQGGSVLVIGGDLLIAAGGKITNAGTQAGPTTALTDSTGGGGSAGGTLASDVATQLIVIPVLLAKLANAQEICVDPGFAGKITAINFRVGDTPVTTAAKLATVTAEIAGTNVTGGAVALTSANCTPSGAQVAGSAITALNTFTSAQRIGINVSAVTAFSEGNGFVELTVVNTDLAAALSTLAVQANALLTILQGIGASS